LAYEIKSTLQCRPDDPTKQKIEICGDGTVNYQSLRWPKTWARGGRCMVDIHELDGAGHQEIPWDPRTLDILKVYLGLVHDDPLVLEKGPAATLLDAQAITLTQNLTLT